jgi:hypothetical protein
LNAAAKNLKAIQSALTQHGGNCGFPVLEIRMSPFEVERLDWPTFRGIPIKADDEIGTGRFRLVCEGQHDETPAPAGTVRLPREVRELAPVA